MAVRFSLPWELVPATRSGSPSLPVNLRANAVWGCVKSVSLKPIYTIFRHCQVKVYVFFYLTQNIFSV